MNDILDYSRIEAGKLKIEQAPLCPGRGDRSRDRHQRPRAYAKGLDCRLHEEGSIASALLDEGSEMAGLVCYILVRFPAYQVGLEEALAAGGGYGYPQVTELAQQLEACAEAGGREQAAELINRFARLFQRIEVGVKVIDAMTQVTQTRR